MYRERQAKRRYCVFQRVKRHVVVDVIDQVGRRVVRDLGNSREVRNLKLRSDFEIRIAGQSPNPQGLHFSQTPARPPPGQLVPRVSESYFVHDARGHDVRVYQSQIVDLFRSEERPRRGRRGALLPREDYQLRTETSPAARGRRPGFRSCAQTGAFAAWQRNAFPGFQACGQVLAD